jgi:hypothetical protein
LGQVNLFCARALIWPFDLVCVPDTPFDKVKISKGIKRRL